MATYYASDSGNSGNSGTIGSPWNLVYAITQLTAGDTLYVEKGDYSLSSTLTISVSGSLGNMINIIGYDTTEDDIISVPYSSYNYGDTPATSNFPILDRGQANLTSAINISGNYVALRNILVTNTGTAINVDGDNNIVDNCVVSGVGRPGDLAYEGIGITIDGDSNTIQNCYVEKSASEGFTCYGSNSLFNDNVAYSVEDYETDYLFVFKGSTGVANRNRAIRNYLGSHESRGLCIKETNGVYTINEHYIYQTKTQINNSSGNIIDGLTMIGNQSTNIEIQNDSNNNTIKNFYSEAGYSGIIFNDNAETGNGMGTNNLLMNGIIKGGDRMILSRNSGGADVSVGTNTIANVVFDNQGSGITSDKAFTSLTLVNCIVVNQTFGTLSIGVESGSTNIIWSHGIFNNNSFLTPSGTALIEDDPEFLNTGTLHDLYKLSSTSPAINSGTTVSGRTEDFEGNSIVGTPDIGAFEYQLTGTPTIYLNERKTFPTAGGFGRYTDGGRGGTVMFVDNLNTSGTGSLRAAVEASGTRNVIFRVDGTIPTSGSAVYNLNDPNISIWGCTAPGDGILVRGTEFRIEASNFFLENFRIRHGSDGSGSNYNNIFLRPDNGQSITTGMIDHMSVSWPHPSGGPGKNIATGTFDNQVATNVTISNCIIAEAELSLLTYQRSYNFSYYNNLMALTTERNVRSNWPVDGTFDFEMVNNIVYGVDRATQPTAGSKFAVINNEYKESSQNSFIDPQGVDYVAITTNESNAGIVVGTSHAYIVGNIVPSGYSQYASGWNPYIQGSAFLSTDLEARALEASELGDTLIGDIGASVQGYDSVDTRITNHYINGDGVVASSGTYPTLSTGSTPYTDTNGDGISDDFTTAHSITDINQIKGVYDFGTFKVDQTGITDWETEGYTALQMFMFTLRGEWDKMEKVGSPVDSVNYIITRILRERRI